MRTDYVNDNILNHILAALMPENSLALRVSLATGLRIGDVLNLRPEHVRPDRQRFTIKEQKTGKSRTVYIPRGLREECYKNAGRFWVFEHRLERLKHRTRQAVFKDMKRAAKAFRVAGHIAPHSVRKAFAVRYFQKTGDIGKVKTLLNHSTEAVTYIYAMADVISAKKHRT